MLKIKKWVPFEDLNFDRWYCEGLHDDYEGFRVLLTGEEKPEPIVRLLFEYVYFYQNRDEGKFLVHEPSEGNYEFPHPFYILENSKLLKRFHEESAGIYAEYPIKHYAIYTTNDCIDVLSIDAPIAMRLSG